MEQFIIWIVILALGIGWEQFRKANRKQEADRDEGTPPPVPLDELWAQFNNPHVNFEETPPPLGPQTILSTPEPKEKLKKVPKEKEKSRKKSPLPHEGVRVTAEGKPGMGEVVNESIYGTDKEREAALASHYERWRRAVIDTEILRRKEF
ncbi:MAG: hypothetical protein NC039_06265 [Muribaculaceae bacterium]|nr:hypothetical protein [Muribaculaceae bacterium]